MAFPPLILLAASVCSLLAAQPACSQSNSLAVSTVSSQSSTVVVPAPSSTVAGSLSVEVMTTLTSTGSTATPTSTPTSLQLSPSTDPPVLTILAANLSNEFVGSSTCTCDILVGRCDVYCCCDQDCTTVDLMGFQCPDGSPPDQVCLVRDDIFRSSLRTCTCPDSSLLCVQTDQNPSRLEYAAAELVTTPEQFSSQITLAGGFVRPSLLTTQLRSYGNRYQAGDPVLLQLSGGSLGTFSLPSALHGLHCHDSNPITYLVDGRSECERSLAPLSSQCASLNSLSPASAYQNMSILEVPADLAGLDTSSITSVAVTLGKLSCRDTEGLEVACEELKPAVPKYSEQNSTCSGVLLEAFYSIIHNGSGAVESVSVDITLGMISASQPVVNQRYGVRFLTVDQEGSLLLQRSGNPGYLNGQPVLAGVASGSEVNISVDQSEWLLIPDSRLDCDADPNRTLSVNFREDVRSACLLSIPLQTVQEDCGSVRDKTRAILSPVPRSHIGVHGNSDPGDITQWVFLLTSSLPETDTDGSVGQVCRGVVTSLNMTLLYANTGQFDSPSAIITGAMLSYGTEDITAVCRGFRCTRATPSVALTLQVAVTFTDVSKGPLQLLKSTSSISGKLPQDFLYPFFVSGTNGLISSNQQTLLLMIELVAIFILSSL